MKARVLHNAISADDFHESREIIVILHRVTKESNMMLFRISEYIFSAG